MHKCMKVSLPGERLINSKYEPKQRILFKYGKNHRDMKFLFTTLLHISAIAVAGVICSSCAKNQDRITIKKYSNGAIKARIDSLKGEAKYYYENGDLSSIIQFQNKRKNGWESKFSSTGELSYKRYWIDDKSYGDTFLYYPNGLPKHYNCFDSYGENFYVIKWDSLGNKIKEEGTVFSPDLVLSDTNGNLILTDSINKNQHFTIQISVSNPPQTKQRLWVGELKNGEEPSDLEEIEIKNNAALHPYYFIESGVRTLFIKGEIINLNGEVLIENRIGVSFTVVDDE